MRDMETYLDGSFSDRKSLGNDAARSNVRRAEAAAPRAALFHRSNEWNKFLERQKEEMRAAFREREDDAEVERERTFFSQLQKMLF